MFLGLPPSHILRIDGVKKIVGDTSFFSEDPNVACKGRTEGAQGCMGQHFILDFLKHNLVSNLLERGGFI